MLRKHLLTFSRINGSYIGPRWVESNTQTFQALCSVQPLKGKEVENLPEGKRNREAIRIYTDLLADIRPAIENSNQNGDLVSIFGKEYEIVAVERWENGLCPHLKVLVVLKC